MSATVSLTVRYGLARSPSYTIVVRISAVLVKDAKSTHVVVVLYVFLTLTLTLTPTLAIR